MSRASTVIVFALAFVLPGCLSEDEAPAALPTDAPVAEGDAPAGGTVDDSPEASGGTLAELHEEFDGTMTSFAIACAVPAGQCVATPTRSPSIGTRIEFEGILVNATAEMTWTPVGPATEVLGLMIMTCDEETQQCMDHGQLEGPSPLAVTAEGIGAPDNRTLYVHAFQPTQNQAASPAILYYELDQPFHLAIHGMRRVAAEA